MKKALQIVLIFVLTVALALGVLSACTPENDNPAHECTSKCDVCGGCKNASCQEDVCKSKCTCKENPQVYMVTFDLAGGECAVDVASGVKVTAGAELDLSAYAVTKQHHTFIGWTDSSSEYAADAKITVNANLTLTAKWQQNTYAVTFDLAGGTCSKDVSEDVKVLAGTELSCRPTS